MKKLKRQNSWLNPCLIYFAANPSDKAINESAETSEEEVSTWLRNKFLDIVNNKQGVALKKTEDRAGLDQINKYIDQIDEKTFLKLTKRAELKDIFEKALNTEGEIGKDKIAFARDILKTKLKETLDRYDRTKDSGNLEKKFETDFKEEFETDYEDFKNIENTEKARKFIDCISTIEGHIENLEGDNWEEYHLGDEGLDYQLAANTIYNWVKRAFIPDGGQLKEGQSEITEKVKKEKQTKLKSLRDKHLKYLKKLAENMNERLEGYFKKREKELIEKHNKLKEDPNVKTLYESLDKDGKLIFDNNLETLQSEIQSIKNAKSFTGEGTPGLKEKKVNTERYNLVLSQYNTMEKRLESIPKKHEVIKKEFENLKSGDVEKVRAEIKDSIDELDKQKDSLPKSKTDEESLAKAIDEFKSSPYYKKYYLNEIGEGNPPGEMPSKLQVILDRDDLNEIKEKVANALQSKEDADYKDEDLEKKQVDKLEEEYKEGKISEPQEFFSNVLDFKNEVESFGPGEWAKNIKFNDGSNMFDSFDIVRNKYLKAIQDAFLSEIPLFQNRSKDEDGNIKIDQNKPFKNWGDLNRDEKQRLRDLHSSLKSIKRDLENANKQLEEMEKETKPQSESKPQIQGKDKNFDDYLNIAKRPIGTLLDKANLNITWLSLADMKRLFEEIGKYISERHHLNSKHRVGSVMGDLLGKKTALGAHYVGMSRQAEVERVNEWKKRMEPCDAWEVLEFLYGSAGEKEKFKATMYKLAEVGRIPWWDKRLWDVIESLNKKEGDPTFRFKPLSFYEKKKNQHIFHDDMTKGIGNIFEDYDLYREFMRNNDSGRDKVKSSYKDKIETLVNNHDGYLGGVLKQVIDKGVEGSRVDPNEVEAFLQETIPKGKMDAPSIIFFLIQFIGIGLISPERMIVFDKLCNQFPTLHGFSQLCWTKDQFEEIARLTRDDSCMPNQTWKVFFSQYLNNTKGVQDRIKKSGTRTGYKDGWDWWTYKDFLAKAEIKTVERKLAMRHQSEEMQDDGAIQNYLSGNLMEALRMWVAYDDSGDYTYDEKAEGKLKVDAKGYTREKRVHLNLAGKPQQAQRYGTGARQPANNDQAEDEFLLKVAQAGGNSIFGAMTVYGFYDRKHEKNYIRYNESQLLKPGTVRFDDFSHDNLNESIATTLSIYREIDKDLVDAINSDFGERSKNLQTYSDYRKLINETGDETRDDQSSNEIIQIYNTLSKKPEYKKEEPDVIKGLAVRQYLSAKYSIHFEEIESLDKLLSNMDGVLGKILQYDKAKGGGEKKKAFLDRAKWVAENKANADNKKPGNSTNLLDPRIRENLIKIQEVVASDEYRNSQIIPDNK